MLLRCLWRRPFQPGPGNSFPAVADSGVQHIPLWFPSILAYTLSIIPSLNSPSSSSLRVLFPPCLRAGAPSSFHEPSLLSPFSLSPSLLPSLTPAPHSSVSSSFLLLLLELGGRRVWQVSLSGSSSGLWLPSSLGGQEYSIPFCTAPSSGWFSECAAHCPASQLPDRAHSSVLCFLPVGNPFIS